MAISKQLPSELEKIKQESKINAILNKGGKSPINNKKNTSSKVCFQLRLEKSIVEEIDKNLDKNIGVFESKKSRNKWIVDTLIEKLNKINK